MSGNKGMGKCYAFLIRHVGYEGDDCILWPYTTNPINGYGHFGYLGKQYGTHRFMCELAHGPRPTAQHVAAHSCHQPACINPRHLSWKTHSENMLDKRANGTASNTNPYGRRGALTVAQVDEIRRLDGIETQAALATRFGVTEKTIRNIQTGKTYAARAA